MKQKQALLLVSFGTRFGRELQKSIQSIEKNICSVFPEMPCFYGIAGELPANAKSDTEQSPIRNVRKVLEELEQDGYDQVICQPLYLTQGREYGKVLSLAAPFAQRLTMFVGLPLMTSQQDCETVASGLMHWIAPPEQNEAIVFVGHGTPDSTNAVYTMLEDTFHSGGWSQVYVGTLSGKPTQVLQGLKQQPNRKRVRLYPLMLTAGVHARRDVDGLWRSCLEKEGYEVNTVLRGLGEIPEIGVLFARHAAEARELVPEK